MADRPFGQNVVVLQNAVAGVGDGVTLPVDGLGTVGFEVTGTFVGTVTFEASIDGAPWYDLRVRNAGSHTAGTTATAAGLYQASIAGYGLVRARVTAYTSGSITVKARAVAVAMGM